MSVTVTHARTVVSVLMDVTNLRALAQPDMTGPRAAIVRSISLSNHMPLYDPNSTCNQL